MYVFTHTCYGVQLMKYVEDGRSRALILRPLHM